MIRNFSSADAAFLGMIGECLTPGKGATTAPRGMGTLEMTSQAFIIHHPRRRVVKGRELRLGYPAAKIAWDLGARRDVETLSHWNPRARSFSDDGKTVQGEDYGARWTPSLKRQLKRLKEDRSTRRAWVPIYEPDDSFMDEGTSNMPCAIGFGLRIISNRLVLQTVMRSQSLYGVFPYDVFLFTTLQELIANELGLDMGWYEHFMLSAHVYEHELKAARELEKVKPSNEEMAPILRSYFEARDRWMDVLDLLTPGRETHRTESDLDLTSADPIEQLMIDNRPTQAH